MELFAERGFESTTVAEIAERAGLTERTFFRHFADKREVLFSGASAFQDAIVSAVGEAPEAATPLEAARAGLDAAAAQLPAREFARTRQVIITANPELQERELIKLATVSSALAEKLRDRGVEEPTASLTAELAVAVFRIAFERWVADGNERDLQELIGDSLDELTALAASRAAG